MGTITPKWDKNENKVATKWEQEPQSGTSGNKNPKVGQEWEQSGNKVGTRTPKRDKNGNKNPKVGQEWEQSGNKVETRTLKWDKNGNKVEKK